MAQIARGQRHSAGVAAVVEQSQHLADFLTGLRPDDLGRHTVRPGWDVATMVAYPIVMQAAALHALDRPTAERPARLSDFFSGLRPWLHRQQDLAAELARHESLSELRDRYRQDLADLASRLAAADAPAAVDTEQHPLRLPDLVRVLSVQLIVHCDDLVESLPDHGPMRWSRGCRGAAVRALTGVLADRHPGQSIEVRVPPFAAVQCGTGADDPRHTRGTPPTVVECDPPVLVRLCVGRLRYADAIRTGAVRASGSRCDLSSWLPLF